MMSSVPRRCDALRAGNLDGHLLGGAARGRGLHGDIDRRAAAPYARLRVRRNAAGLAAHHEVIAAAHGQQFRAALVDLVEHACTDATAARFAATEGAG